MEGGEEGEGGEGMHPGEMDANGFGGKNKFRVLFGFSDA
jgi:hypothetical protein